MSDRIINNVVIYKSTAEIDNVAFDIIRDHLPRDYFRIGDLGINFLRKDHCTLKIIGIDNYEP
jgi:hypothetical protein